MKLKLLVLSILFFVFNSILFSANINGEVSVDSGEDFGVFVYVENENIYDISDGEGKFTLSNLEAGKTYTLVFQKDDYPDMRKKISIKDENTVEFFEIKRGGAGGAEKKKVKIAVRTPIKDKKVFVEFKEKGFGLILNPDEVFYSELELGEYSAVISQEGSYSKTVNFSVEDEEINNLGIFSLDELPTNSLNIDFKSSIKDGYYFLYKDDVLKRSSRLSGKNKRLELKNLEEGKYRLKIVAYEYKDFKKDFYLKGKKNLQVKLKKLGDYNNIYVNIYPDNIEVDLKLFSEGILLRKEKGARGLYVFDKLDTKKKYIVVASSDRYIENEKREIKAGENINISLERDIKGAVLSGNVSPFISNAEVMVLADGKILGKTLTDKNGHFTLEIDEMETGRKILRVKADGFNVKKEYRVINKGVHQEEVNLTLEPHGTNLYGDVKAPGKNTDSSNFLVIIEELNLWQHTNKNGEFYFRNIKPGIYNVSVKKLGYKDEIKNKIVVTKNSSKEVKFVMKPEGKLAIKANFSEYDVILNGKKYDVSSKVFENIIVPGKYELIAKKKGYLDYNEKFEITEPGEVKEVVITFLSVIGFKEEISKMLDQAEDYIDKLEIEKAEEIIEDIESREYSYLFKKRLKEVRDSLSMAKRTVFDTDREIILELDDIREKITLIEEADIGYAEKKKRLDEYYKLIVERLEKLLKEKYYTTHKRKIYNFIGDIYTKLGMINSAERSYDLGKEYSKGE